MTVFPGSKATLLEDLAITSGGVLLADIAGSDIDTEYGEIEVVGNVTLGGSLRVVLSGGFTPAEGDSFQILRSHGGIEGSLALYAMPALPGQLAWDLDVTMNQCSAECRDGAHRRFQPRRHRRRSRLPRVAHERGQSGSDLTADATHDGRVDDADYALWKANFGATAGAISAGSAALNTAVPEPATLGVLLMGLIAAARSTCRTFGHSRRI